MRPTGTLPSFATGWKLAVFLISWEFPRALGVWTGPPTATVPPHHSGRGAPATRYDYGKQRPMSVLEAARKANGWKVVRWRQGTKGWLESRFVAMRVQPSHGFVRGEPPHQGIMAAGGMAGGGERTH